MLNSGGIKSLGDTIYYAASGFCSGNKYCCNNKDVSAPEIQVTTNLFGGGFPENKYNSLELNISCKDPQLNSQGTGCLEGYWYSFVYSGLSLRCPEIVNPQFYKQVSSSSKLVFNLALINNNLPYFSKYGNREINDDVFVCVAVKDKLGKTAIYKSPILHYIYLPTCQICSNLAGFPCLCGSNAQKNNFILDDASHYCLFCDKTGEIFDKNSKEECDNEFEKNSCSTMI
jgi:hypothetical protein